MINIIGSSLYGYMFGFGTTTSQQNIPGRLAVVSYGEIALMNGDVNIFGIRGHELAASVDGDYLAFSSDAYPCVEDGMVDVRISEEADALISRKTLSADVYENGLLITYSGNATLLTAGCSLAAVTDWNPGEDEYVYARVTGKKECSRPADDYLVSRKSLYGEFRDDGLMIYYAGSVEFSLEKVQI